MFFLQFQIVFKKYASIFNLRYITAAKMIMASKQEITFNFINGLPSFAVFQFSQIIFVRKIHNTSLTDFLFLKRLFRMLGNNFHKYEVV
ncbi:hypothetical protein CLOBOL_06323 [Enterocloster bolteae ATCC BAA-613]|uniref:Uncharacterized protein n=1 Tax=Enterocloster bolteae (strain ATCC BAA-613 / DSM 15670 / CCUG 46953 / JCM 12243 / WAL 16351) TaxID=411902 RepID=A8S2I9_ENTBW|nr:hypothetical protein CLOBOL_06323 [Enterocloster bolteae ATCC BAA-613]